MGQQGSGGQGYSPVDNNTYNLLKALTKKLEALEVYATYEQDADERSRGVFQELAQRDRESVDRLLQTLKETLR